jgi:hypothetical protein
MRIIHNGCDNATYEKADCQISSDVLESAFLMASLKLNADFNPMVIGEPEAEINRQDYQSLFNRKERSMVKWLIP